MLFHVFGASQREEMSIQATLAASQSHEETHAAARVRGLSELHCKEMHDSRSIMSLTRTIARSPIDGLI